MILGWGGGGALDPLFGAGEGRKGKRWEDHRVYWDC